MTREGDLGAGIEMSTLVTETEPNTQINSKWNNWFDFKSNHGKICMIRLLLF